MKVSESWDKVGCKPKLRLGAQKKRPPSATAVREVTGWNFGRAPTVLTEFSDGIRIMQCL
jgi:hypothetical protein